MFFNKLVTRSAQENLLFFPHGGGSGENYQAWFKYFDETIHCDYARLPGRSIRFNDPAFDNLTELLDVLTPEVLCFCDKPLNLFGHSMGGLIAFELARRLFFDHNVTVKNLFISSHEPPCLPLIDEPLHQLPKDRLFQRLQEMGGLDTGFEVTIEHLEPFFPTLYSDFKLCELYQYYKTLPLPVAMIVFWGKDDEFIEKDKMVLWQQESSLPVAYHIFEGGHFYYHAQLEKLIYLMRKYLCKKIKI